jgi:hypothetical protein
MKTNEGEESSKQDSYEKEGKENRKQKDRVFEGK